MYIFDGDGVTIRPGGFAAALENEFGWSGETTAAFFRGPFQDCLVGQRDLGETLPQFLDSWGWPGSVEAFINLWLRSDDQPEPLVLNAVRRLRAQGITCCLASNQDLTRAQYIADRMQFSELFDRLFFSCHIKLKKPDVSFFHAITSRLGVAAKSVHYFDDQVTNVTAAREAGWRASLIQSPDELLRIL